jgi:hypothetical protein
MDSKLNQLQRLLPDGLLVDAGWLQRQGYSRSLVAKYVKGGWLEAPVREAYRRPGDAPRDEPPSPMTVVLSLQRLRPPLLAVGGRTALELLGLGHCSAADGPTEYHLNGAASPPLWARRLLGQRLVYHRPGLFLADPLLTDDPRAGGFDRHFTHPEGSGLAAQLVVSTPERAFLEVLETVPQVTSFHEADVLMQGLGSLSPRRLYALLADCRSVKVKRLALWFADRHAHAWAQRLERGAIDLGSGKRVLAPGGKLDATYNITVPREMEAP